MVRVFVYAACALMCLYCLGCGGNGTVASLPSGNGQTPSPAAGVPATLDYTVSSSSSTSQTACACETDAGAYNQTVYSSDTGSTLTFYGQSTSDNSGPYVAVVLTGHDLLPATYPLSKNNGNHVTLTFSPSSGSPLGVYTSTSGQVKITSPGSTNQDWKGSFACTAVCASTDDTIQVSGTFDFLRPRVHPL